MKYPPLLVAVKQPPVWPQRLLRRIPIGTKDCVGTHRLSAEDLHEAACDLGLGRYTHDAIELPAGPQ
jgi:hypothetical protein